MDGGATGAVLPQGCTLSCIQLSVPGTFGVSMSGLCSGSFLVSHLGGSVTVQRAQVGTWRPQNQPAQRDSDTSAGHSELHFHDVQGAQGDNKSNQASGTYLMHIRSYNKPVLLTPRTGFPKHGGAAAYGPKSAFWANPCMPETILEDPKESVKPEATSSLLRRLGQQSVPPRAGCSQVRANTS